MLINRNAYLIRVDDKQFDCIKLPILLPLSDVGPKKKKKNGNTKKNISRSRPSRPRLFKNYHPKRFNQSLREILRTMILD